MKVKQKDTTAANDKPEPTSAKQENQGEKSYVIESAELSQNGESPGLKQYGGLPRTPSATSHSREVGGTNLDFDN